MNAWPDAPAIGAFLARVARRLALVRAVEGAAAGLLVGFLVSLAASPVHPVLAGLLGLGAVTFGAALRLAFGERFEFGWWHAAPAIAERVERRAPICRNIVLTATELIDNPGSANAEIGRLVCRKALVAVAALDPAGLFPIRSPAMALAATVALFAASLAWRPPVSVDGMPGRTTVAPRPISIDGVDVVVVPPGYTGLPERSSSDPARVEALAGSRVRVTVRGQASSVTLETVSGRQALADDGGLWSAAVTATNDDYLAIEALDDRGVAGARRLIGLSVALDRVPRVRITAPGRDLFFATVPDSLVLAVEADDDLGLATLRLRFTSVFGGGEQFTFTEQEVPLTVTRRDGQHWAASGVWRIGRLALTPGDVVVYGAEATDRRPDRGPARSESYVLEMVSPSAIAAEGFAADDERDRYAVSQQMVILKTERLLSRRNGATRDSVIRESQRLAAEQRQVRAEFVFMMGGELAEADDAASGTLMVDETAEAEAEGDLLAGRMQNRGRVEMQRAIRAMSRAAALLVEADLDRALADERVALDNLMRAFARSRFLLRALTQREALDLTRRLSGSLDAAAGDKRRGIEPMMDPRVTVLRQLLVDVASLSARQAFDAEASRTASASALGLMRVGTGDDSLRALAARLDSAAGAMGRASAAESRALLERIALDLAAIVRAAVPEAPMESGRIDQNVLRGALADALRRGRGGG